MKSAPDRLLVPIFLFSFLIMLPAAGEETSVGLGMWKPMAPAPTTRTEVSAAAVGGTIYVIGGFQEPSLGNLKDLAISRQVEAYDPSADRWSTKASLPIGLHHTGIGVVENKLYIIGGFTKSFLSVWEPTAGVYQYDPQSDSWTERAPMPTMRGALAVAEVSGKLLAIGGGGGGGK